MTDFVSVGSTVKVWGHPVNEWRMAMGALYIIEMQGPLGMGTWSQNKHRRTEAVVVTEPLHHWIRSGHTDIASSRSGCQKVK